MPLSSHRLNTNVLRSVRHTSYILGRACRRGGPRSCRFSPRHTAQRSPPESLSEGFLTPIRYASDDKRQRLGGCSQLSSAGTAELRAENRSGIGISNMYLPLATDVGRACESLAGELVKRASDEPTAPFTQSHVRLFPVRIAGRTAHFLTGTQTQWIAIYWIEGMFVDKPRHEPRCIGAIGLTRNAFFGQYRRILLRLEPLHCAVRPLPVQALRSRMVSRF